MADHDEVSAPGCEKLVHAPAVLLVQIVGGLIQQCDLRTAQLHPGEGDEPRLAPGELANFAVERNVEPEAVKECSSSFLDVPAGVTEGVKVFGPRAAVLDCSQGSDRLGDAQQIHHGRGGVEGGVLREVCDLSVRLHHAGGGLDLVCDQLQECRFPSPVAANEGGAPLRERDGGMVEDLASIRPAERNVVERDGRGGVLHISPRSLVQTYRMGAIRVILQVPTCLRVMHTCRGSDIVSGQYAVMWALIMANLSDCDGRRTTCERPPSGYRFETDGSRSTSYA